jgi:hypothetical protein
MWNERVVCPGRGEKPLQILAIQRFNYANNRDSQPALMCNSVRLITVVLYGKQVQKIRIRSNAEGAINLLKYA